MHTAEIKTLVAGNTLHMQSWDKVDKADVEFSAKGGKLNATNALGGKTWGRWRVTDDKLCLEFRWFGGHDGGMECFYVYNFKKRYHLFKPSGALVDTFVPEHQVEYTSADINVGIAGGVPREWSSSQKTATKKDKKPVVIKEAAVAPIPQHSSSATVSTTPSYGIYPSAPAAPVVSSVVPAIEDDGKRLSSHHKLLLETGDCPGCDLSGLDLSRLSLKGADLQGADLSLTNLSESNLKGANLAGANLQGAIFSDATLTKANLQKANLREANLHWADLSQADLRGAIMQRAYLVKAVFYKADLRDADMSDVVSQRTIFSKAKGVAKEVLEANK